LGQKKKDPHQRLDTLERVSGWGTLVILAGIVLEIWGFFGLNPGNPNERVFSLVANSLIALGLIIEYVAIRLTIVAAGEAKQESDEKIAEANARADEANASALEAQLALEKFRKPWALPIWKLPEYEKILKPFAGTKFRLWTIDDHDPLRLARVLRQAMAWGGWTAAPLLGRNDDGIELMPEYDGIDIRIDQTRANEWLGAAQAVAQVLQSEDIPAEARVMESGTPNDAINIFIGRKT
jgi:hypothetical protein